MKIDDRLGVGRADVAGALDVDVENDVLPRGQARQHLGLGRPVEVAVHLVVLEEVVRAGPSSGTPSPRRSGTPDRRSRPSRADASCATPRNRSGAPGGSASSRRMSVVLPPPDGEDTMKRSPLRRRAHSTFWTCSRIFSVSAFMSRTSRVTWRSRPSSRACSAPAGSPGRGSRASCRRAAGALAISPSNWSR